MGENDGVEPSSKNHGGVDQMQNAFETPPFLHLAGCERFLLVSSSPPIKRTPRDAQVR